MADQNELIEQYRTTLEVMKDKLYNLKEEKEKQNQELLEKKTTDAEYKKLEQSLELLQEGIQSINLEIFKEKGNLRKLKADNEWDEEKMQNSQELSELNEELEELLNKNQVLRSNHNNSNTESKLAQLEETNPKLFALVKKIIVAEETNLLLVEELTFLEQEKNKTRADYYKITQFLGQEEKIKLKIREIEKEIERSEYNIQNLKNKVNDAVLNLEKEKETVNRSEIKELLRKNDDLKNVKQDINQKIHDLNENIYHLEAEIISEKKCENKSPPTNLKQEIKNLEAEITEKSKELKIKQAEKKKLFLQYEQKLKDTALIRRSRVKISKDSRTKSPLKLALSKSTSNFNTEKRDIIVDLVGKSIAEGNPSHMKHALRHIGSQGQGIASKLVQLNRDEFLKKIKYS